GLHEQWTHHGLRRRFRGRASPATACREQNSEADEQHAPAFHACTSIVSLRTGTEGMLRRLSFSKMSNRGAVVFRFTLIVCVLPAVMVMGTGVPVPGALIGISSDPTPEPNVKFGSTDSKYNTQFPAGRGIRK